MSTRTSQNSNQIAQDAIEADYGDDILYAGWNPEVDSVSRQLNIAPAGNGADQSSTHSADLTAKFAELFLRKMYSFQR